jgi:hypothetical protein
MPTYTVKGTVKAPFTTDVEASSPEAAISAVVADPTKASGGADKDAKPDVLVTSTVVKAETPAPAK